MAIYWKRVSIWMILAFATDQISKHYITHVLKMSLGEFRPIIDPILNWQYVRNYGINFGLFSQDSHITRWLLIILTIAIVAVVIMWMGKQLTPLTAIFLGLLIGGAAGNIFDRIVYGSVTDFINNSWYTFHNPFSYNLADVWIFVGLIGMIIWEPKNK